MRTASRIAGTHLVDTAGLVGCPERRRDVAFEECLSCLRLTGLERDEHGRVTEIHCSGGRRQSPWNSPWVWIGPFGS